MLKRFISLILVILIILSISLSTASADGTSTVPRFVVINAQGIIGETVDVKIYLESNPGITALQMKVGYSSDDLELISVEDGSLFNDSLSHSKLSKNPLIISWYSSCSSDEKTDGCFAILKFKILNNASDSEVIITYNEDNVFDSSFNNVKFDVVNGTVKVVSTPCYNGHTKVIDKAVAPTCTKTGLTEGSHCSVCNTVLVEQKVVAAKGHTKVVDKAVASTCTKTGLTEGSHCSVCNTVLVEQKVVAAKGHKEVIDKAVAATCTATGLTEGKHCSVCNAVLVEQKVVAAKGHKEVIDKAVAATCTATGLTEGSHCSVCDTVIIKQETVPVLGHNYVDGACVNCGEKSCPYTYVILEDNTIKITKFIGNDSEVIIPSTIDNHKVSVIGDSAFRNNTNITSVIIPEGIAKIESWAFYGCDSMTKVTLPSTVTIVGSNAFHSCSTLKACNFTGTTDDWCNITFESYYSNPLACGQYFYINDKLVTEIRIKDGTTKIKEYTFVGCRSISEITIPNSVKTIEKYALCNLVKCDYLGTVEDWCGINFEDNTSSPTYFGADLYIKGELLTDLIVPETITAINNYAFMYCDKIKCITISNGVNTIGDYAFNNCTGVETVFISSDVVSIGKCAFLNCSKIKSIELPECLECIGEKAFYNCSGLKNIIISSSVNNIDFAAFNGNSSLEHILCVGTESEWNSIKIGSSNISLTNVNVHFANTNGYTDVTPSCTEKGYVSHKCPVCSYEFKETVYTPATGHTIVIDKGYAPTDTKTGLTDGSHCSVCNEILVKQEVIPMLSGVIGDVNLDTVVNVKDATAVQKYVASLIDLSDEAKRCADFDRNGNINVKDATGIQKRVAGLI